MPSPDWKTMESAPKDGTFIKVRGWNWGDPTKGRHYAHAVYHDGNWTEVGTEGTILYYLTDWHQ